MLFAFFRIESLIIGEQAILIISYFAFVPPCFILLWFMSGMLFVFFINNRHRLIERRLGKIDLLGFYVVSLFFVTIKKPAEPTVL